MTKTRQQIIEETVLWVRHDLDAFLPQEIEKCGYAQQDREVKKILRDRLGHSQEFKERFAFP